MKKNDWLLLGALGVGGYLLLRGNQGPAPTIEQQPDGFTGGLLDLAGNLGNILPPGSFLNPGAGAESAKDIVSGAADATYSAFSNAVRTAGNYASTAVGAATGVIKPGEIITYGRAQSPADEQAIIQAARLYGAPEPNFATLEGEIQYVPVQAAVTPKASTTKTISVPAPSNYTPLNYTPSSSPAPSSSSHVSGAASSPSSSPTTTVNSVNRVLLPSTYQKTSVQSGGRTYTYSGTTADGKRVYT